MSLDLSVSECRGVSGNSQPVIHDWNVVISSFCFWIVDGSQFRTGVGPHSSNTFHPPVLQKVGFERGGRAPETAPP